MTGDWSEDARGIWQSQQSAVTLMSTEEMRSRASRWNREFEATNWIAFVCAAGLLLFFVPMLIISETTLQRAGAAIGIVSAAYLVSVGLRIASRRWTDGSATCVHAYKAQLERRRKADMGSARTILLMMLGCALLSTPADGGPWALQAIGQLGAGIITYVYISRQARRFQARIDELDRLEAN